VQFFQFVDALISDEVIAEEQFLQPILALNYFRDTFENAIVREEIEPQSQNT
jgi:hypothetical protein